MKNTLSTQPVGRPCSVCSMQPSRRAEVESMIETGIAVSIVSTRFAISKSSLYRHINAHASGVARELNAVAYAAAPTAFMARLAEISDDMRTLRRGAVASGNVMAATRAAEAETRALIALVDKLGVESTSISESLGELGQFASAVAQASRQDPEIGEFLASVLDKNGHSDIAAQLRTSISSRQTGN
jgi:hypothetical protein